MRQYRRQGRVRRPGDRGHNRPMPTRRRRNRQRGATGRITHRQIPRQRGRRPVPACRGQCHLQVQRVLAAEDVAGESNRPLPARRQDVGVTVAGIGHRVGPARQPDNVVGAADENHVGARRRHRRDLTLADRGMRRVGRDPDRRRQRAGAGAGIG